MKLQYDSVRDRRQLDGLVQFLLQSLRGKTFTGKKAAKLFNEIFGLSIDWHEYSRVLDYLHSIGEAKVCGHTSDGMTIYVIN